MAAVFTLIGTVFLPHKHSCMHLCTLLYTYVYIRTRLDAFEYITCLYSHVYVHAF